MSTTAIHYIESPEQLEALLKQHAAVLLFGAPSCGVCQALKPHIAAMLAKNFPKMLLAYIDCEAQVEIAARYHVFSLPVVESVFYGKPFGRFSKVFSLSDLKEAIARPYELMDEE
ncbi:thioredoxin family protein [Shewanella sp. CG12_big_fil_rev_8_21_14_0_65_47_15]|uniref:thioredoxin family protein n=1 Tax=Shewanella sp. CG12_big_fil_rev_8_21_14_0_65_47_15 TaxID=1975537 RepID=UPI000CC9900A|nr:thioredoxin family protein [Shewanella sp. CG12_big_fil_rev_8_21_14_0_65_47_15]PIW62269.1 MAG: thioredoxin [Shewanella sp. CG12_big_fil_rev_8_21_14_0_65_47_15]